MSGKLDDEIDILNIHERICKKLLSEPANIKKLEKDKLCIDSTIDKYRSIGGGSPDKLDILIKESENIQNEIDLAKTCDTYNFYILEVYEIIEAYKNELKKPMKIVPGKKLKRNRHIADLVESFIKIAKKYDVSFDVTKSTAKNSFYKLNTAVCENCGNSKHFKIADDTVYTCLKCSAQHITVSHASAYNDIDRVNISCQYTYKRELHFKDCINQYQGKQNYFIADDVYEKLEKELELHHILVPDAKTKEERFSRVTKKQLLLFMENVNLTNHYENIHLIYSTMTGKQLDNIGYLEDLLINDFDMLLELYDKTITGKSSRKNFINVQYVLYQLLLKYNHPCNKDDFILLKSLDTCREHDNICRQLFETLGWNFQSMF